MSGHSIHTDDAPRQRKYKSGSGMARGFLVGASDLYPDSPDAHSSMGGMMSRAFGSRPRSSYSSYGESGLFAPEVLHKTFYNGTEHQVIVRGTADHFVPQTLPTSSWTM